MKRILTTILLTALIFSTIWAAGSVTVLENQKLFDANQGYTSPHYASTGDEILLSGEGFHGLWAWQRKTAEVTMISDAAGSGYSPLALNDGRILYRQDDFRAGRRYTTLRLYDNATKGAEALTAGERFVSDALVSGGQLLYFSDSDARRVTLSANSKSVIEEPQLINTNTTLYVLRSGKWTTFSPRGEGQYLWGQLSPDRQRVLFTKAGEGTFVCDLQGRIIASLGYAQAPDWSMDGKYISYMMDEDDGERITASDIWIYSLADKTAENLSNSSDKIELYPNWAPDRYSIVYQTLDNAIYELKLEVRN